MMINSKIKVFLSLIFLICLVSQGANAQIGIRSSSYLGGVFDVGQAYYRTESITGRPALPSTVGSYAVDLGFSFGAELGTEIDVFKKKYGLQMGLGIDAQLGQALKTADGKFRFADIFVFGRLKYKTNFKFKPFVALRLGIARHTGDDQYVSHDFEGIQLEIDESFQKKIYLRDGLYLGAGGGFFIGERTFFEALFSFRSAKRRTDNVFVEFNYTAVLATLGYQFGDWK